MVRLGGGCSQYIAKPAWQSDAGCAKRTSNDLSAYADPNPGVAVFDSYLSQKPGWRTYGGTSVSAPIVAGAIALAGNGKSALLNASYIYAHAAAQPDHSGTNGTCDRTCARPAPATARRPATARPTEGAL